VDCNKQLSISASQMDVEHVTLDPSDPSSLPGIQDFIDEFKVRVFLPDSRLHARLNRAFRCVP
jgi:hypothetical protein